MATWTLELTTQVKYVSPPGAKFMTAHLCEQASSAFLAQSSWIAALSCNTRSHSYSALHTSNRWLTSKRDSY